MTDRDDDAQADTSDADRAEDEEKTNVDVSDAGTVEPKDPTWEKPSVDDIPEFETGGRNPSGDVRTTRSPSSGVHSRSSARSRPASRSTFPTPRPSTTT